ncbi:glutamate 5-kinase [Salipaludibacillus agaradhaerens]|uniref:glutamate 5-kinase n=1 Tax=Salipaludibacillus agaradhaerens TaxID=76935 RepID=UPI000997B26E|nr:glutamate 5-kinase [Salipaludibacillus agaradhaerens]
MARKRLVIKIGSSSLTTKDGQLSIDNINHYTRMIAELKRCDHDIILISSGAVAAGFTKLGYPARPVTVAGKQAAAAVGQNLLMQAYADCFSKEQLVAAQLLLTRHDFVEEEQYRNAFNTLDELLRRHVIPIINENDSIAVDELTFGDNDMLSALVSGFVHADQLIILTDIDGIYDANPMENPNARKYTHLTGVSDKLMTSASGSSSKVGTGGMKSKLEAARTAHMMGIPVFIGTAVEEHSLVQIIKGHGNGTYLYPHTLKMMKNKQQWLAFHSLSSGKIIIDNGAEKAVLKRGKSLLPVGIKEVEGHFSAGAVVDVFNENGRLIGRGKINYDAGDLLELLSCTDNTDAKHREAIHRNQWFSIL